jgi:hypothetical protein
MMRLENPVPATTDPPFVLLNKSLLTSPVPAETDPPVVKILETNCNKPLLPPTKPPEATIRFKRFVRAEPALSEPPEPISK